ncbi:MAG: hypothetical protein JSV03_00285 [Planctomycetota bacterium]|nr:MAG: hypothetical protein JSV03_00285 [Planctomycetota bacterium]
MDVFVHAFHLLHGAADLHHEFLAVCFSPVFDPCRPCFGPGIGPVVFVGDAVDYAGVFADGIQYLINERLLCLVKYFIAAVEFRVSGFAVFVGEIGILVTVDWT